MVRALGVVVHQPTLPMAWKVVRGNTQGAWRPLGETRLRRGRVPQDCTGVWADRLGLGVAAGVGGNRVQRMASAEAGECAGHLSFVGGASVGGVLFGAGGSAGVGEAFSHRLRWTWVVFWGIETHEPW